MATSDGWHTVKPVIKSVVREQAAGVTTALREQCSYWYGYNRTRGELTKCCTYFFNKGCAKGSQCPYWHGKPGTEPEFKESLDKWLQ
jgi:hypothetical protein